jgi:hypothetical protein
MKWFIVFNVGLVIAYFGDRVLEVFLNLIPAFLAWFFWDWGSTSGRKTKTFLLSFSLTSVLLSVGWLLPWMTGVGAVGESSSTVAIAHLFAPFWIVFFSGVVGIIAVAVRHARDETG